MGSQGLRGNSPGSPRRRVSPSPGPCQLRSLLATAGAPTPAARAHRTWRAALPLRGADRPRPLLALLGRRPALATNFAQVSCTTAAAPLSALLLRSVRPPVRRAEGPSLLGSPARTQQVRRRRGWRRGFKETAQSPQFAGPRCGCFRFPDSRSTVGPFAAQTATLQLLTRREPCARSQVSVATCVCTSLQPAMGVHVQPRLRVYIWGHAEEVEPRTPGGRRDQRSLLPLPHP